MDNADHVALPKGIVVNTSTIYQEVANFPQVPPDQVWKYWRVYTTTNKKLQDPIARRLENFWWHVLGSDRRLLSGNVLASIYEHISLGPTFVPLRGPPNRWEGPDSSTPSRPTVHLSGTSQQGEMLADGKGPSKSDLVLSSASRPPPAHPILKKPRGPSTTGPRPTARFISPHESEEEQYMEGDIPSSGSTVTPGLEMRTPNPSPPKKKAPVQAKKFVASAGHSKRRPVIRRKSSSQPSGVPKLTSKDAAAAAPISQSPQEILSPKTPVAPDVPGPSSHESSKPTHNTSSVDSNRSQQLSEKAAGKRPAVVRSATTDKMTRTSRPQAPYMTRQSSHHDLISTRKSLAKLSEGVQNNHSPFHKEIDAPEVSSPPNPPAPMLRSQSHSGFIRPREGIHIKAPNPKLFTGATASTTNIAAQGTIIDQAGSVGSLPITHHFGHRFDEDVSPTSSLLDSHLTPTQPSTSASVPLGRTKSQLTLLLEREKARAGNKPRSRS